MKYATGYKRSAPGHQRTHFRHLATRLGAAVTVLPMLASLEAFLPPTLDQNQTRSCTGGSHAAAYFTCLAATGNPLGFVPSPRGLYLNARCIERVPREDGTLPDLEDTGASASDVTRGAQQYGVRPMRAPTSTGLNYDAEPSNVNDEPALGDLEEEAKTLLIGDYELSDDGPARRREIQQAIAAGYPVTVGIAGGCDAFQGYAGGVLPALHSEVDHCVFLYGYETQPDGTVVYLGRNSWGTGWGEQGNFRLSEAAVDELEDCIVLAVQVVA